MFIIEVVFYSGVKLDCIIMRGVSNTLITQVSPDVVVGRCEVDTTHVCLLNMKLYPAVG